MYEIKQIPPAKMTADQRLSEVANLLTNGLLRVRQMHEKLDHSYAENAEVQLGFCPQKSVHTNPNIHNKEFI